MMRMAACPVAHYQECARFEAPAGHHPADAGHDQHQADEEADRDAGKRDVGDRPQAEHDVNDADREQSSRTMPRRVKAPMSFMMPSKMQQQADDEDQRDRAQRRIRE